MNMQYRKLPHGEEQISIIGLGTSSIGMAGDQEIEATVELAMDSGVNFFDMASADAAPFPAYGRAMAGARDKIYFQIHFGADYHSGKYGWTTDLDTIKRSIGGNSKFCVTAKSGANRVKFIMGGRRIKRLPPCLQHNANGTGCQGGAIISPQPSI